MTTKLDGIVPSALCTESYELKKVAERGVQGCRIKTFGITAAALVAATLADQFHSTERSPKIIHIAKHAFLVVA